MPIFTKRTVIYFSGCGNVDSLRSRIDYILLGLFLIEFMVKGNSLQDIKDNVCIHGNSLCFEGNDHYSDFPKHYLEEYQA